MSALHLEVSGRGPPLLMLHGWGLNLRVFDALAGELADFRVLRLDLSGHGASAWDPRASSVAGQAQWVAETVRSHLGPCAVLGWSIGGQIALELAAAAPGLVERLVLVAATPRFTTSNDWPHGMTLQALESFATRLEEDWRRTVSDFLELQVRGSAGGERVLRQLQSALIAHGEARPEALAAGLASLRDTDLRARLREVRQPALVIAGQYDRITPPLASRALAKELASARYLELRRAGHAPFLSHTREFVQAVRGVLA